ncbi:32608_t:CDS:2 [Gigaspora margarita]|uniref:32608_t:CDS:1 n=1 Tax=Gigaspora margarita TaxID=4874 RepID=A0ABN7W3D0_GIGMA|nr:32608_t:CDS:2 [Gigaspora margarita]
MTNQSVENSLLQEIDSILSAEMPIPSYDDSKLLKYTTATIYETLRLYPIVPVNGKDEKIWGEDAKQFNPKRFLNSEDGLRPNKFKFASFHAGPRTWLVLLIIVLNNLNLKLVPGQKSPPEFGEAITLPMKDPLMTKVSYRTKI